MTQNLMDGLLSEITRVKDLVKEYEDLPDNAGRFAIMMLNQDIHRAEEAIKEDDTKKMITAYKLLKECE